MKRSFRAAAPGLMVAAVRQLSKGKTGLHADEANNLFQHSSDSIFGMRATLGATSGPCSRLPVT